MGERRLPPGAVFAGYTVERLLGEGGMGAVYLAAHPRLPKYDALKLLRSALTNDDYVRSRFELEADHVARLAHPNIVAVHDRGREGDQLWIAMQFVDGTNVETELESGPLEPRRAVHIITETAAALDYAHANGVLHRDVKPANILLEPDKAGRSDHVYLADFGIAKALAETQHLTHTGMLVASLQYAAPEQFDNVQLDHRADVYSLGCTLFHMLTGQQPYPGTTLPQLWAGHTQAEIPMPSVLRPGVPVGFDGVIATAMAKSRADRFASCGELATAARVALGTADSNLGNPAETIVAPRVPELPKVFEYGPIESASGIQNISATTRRVVERSHPGLSEPSREQRRQGHVRTGQIAAIALAIVAVVGFAVVQAMYWKWGPFSRLNQDNILLLIPDDSSLRTVVGGLALVPLLIGLLVATPRTRLLGLYAFSVSGICCLIALVALQTNSEFEAASMTARTIAFWLCILWTAASLFAVLLLFVTRRR